MPEASAAIEVPGPNAWEILAAEDRVLLDNVRLDVGESPNALAREWLCCAAVAVTSTHAVNEVADAGGIFGEGGEVFAG